MCQNTKLLSDSNKLSSPYCVALIALSFIWTGLMVGSDKWTFSLLYLEIDIIETSLFSCLAKVLEVLETRVVSYLSLLNLVAFLHNQQIIRFKLKLLFFKEFLEQTVS